MLQETKEALENKLMLRMMSHIEDEPEISQRTLSAELGVAIGLVNAYIKRCVKKGWIKVQHVPTRRYTYYLTPIGFLEKAKLTAEYLRSSFDFFRDAQNQFLQLFEYCETEGWERLVLVGAGELAEIAFQVAKKANVSVIIVPTHDFTWHADLDAVLLTDVVAPQLAFEHLQTLMPQQRILIPALLHVSRGSKGRIKS